MPKTYPNTEYSTSTLYLLRHGEIATPGILAGHTDVELSEKGMQQLVQSSSKLKNVTQVYSSPLKRCFDFSQQYSRRKSISLKVDDRLKEMNFGQWDGKAYKALWSEPESSQLIGSFWRDPWQVTPPDAEHIDLFIKRVDNWWELLITELRLGEERSKKDRVLGDTLVVTHAGVIKLLLARIINMPIPGAHHLSCFDIPYAGIIKIEIFHDAHGISWSKIVF